MSHAYTENEKNVSQLFKNPDDCFHLISQDDSLVSDCRAHWRNHHGTQKQLNYFLYSPMIILTNYGFISVICSLYLYSFRPIVF